MTAPLPLAPLPAAAESAAEAAAVRGVAAVGRATRRAVNPIGAGARFTADVLRGLPDTRAWLPEFSTHARILGVESLPIGMFIALFTGIVLALLASYSVGGRTRHVVVRTRDVGGVALGNPVVIRGVRAGRVEGIALGEKGWVVLHLGLEKATPLPSDPVVLLTASSLFGEWQATITELAGVPPDRELRAAIAAARTTGDTLAGAVLPDIAQLTTVAGRLAGDVAKVADRVQVAFDDAAARELRESIRNVAELSRVLAQTVTRQSTNLDRISTDVQTGIGRINAAADRINTFSARVDSATDRGELQQLVSNSQHAAQELLTAATRLRELSGNFEQTQTRLASAVARADSVLTRMNSRDGTMGLMLNDPSLYRQSDSLVRELRGLVKDVQRDPRRFFTLRVF